MKAEITITMTEEQAITNTITEVECARKFIEDVYANMIDMAMEQRANSRANEQLLAQATRLDGVMYLIDDVINRLNAFDI